MQYYVQFDDAQHDLVDKEKIVPFERDAMQAQQSLTHNEEIPIETFLILPAVAPRKRHRITAMVDYSKSLIVTSTHHIATMEELMHQRDATAIQKQNLKRGYKEENPKPQSKATRIVEKQAQWLEKEA